MMSCAASILCILLLLLETLVDGSSQCACSGEQAEGSLMM
jgi:hypothetical protein